MNFLDRKISILLIEDEDIHATQVKETLGEQYEVVHLTWLDKVQLYNYKAINPDSQIVIVDLVLGTKDNPHEGYETIRQDLWPLDRTTFFIVFSQYLEETNLPPINRFDPHWAFVNKEVAEEKLTVHCLANLLSIVESCVECSSPVIEKPRYDPEQWSKKILEYKSRFPLVDSKAIPVENIERSVRVLNDLSGAASPYSKVGQASREIAIGVFGSCGRMEMRGDSDIECTVYFGGDNSLVASTFWNRITKYISSKTWHYEGQDVIDKSPTKFLLPDQVDERIKNRYMPLISKESLLNGNLDREPELRDRHFQVLTELRPVFNPNFILEMKRDMILRNCNNTDLRAIIDSPYMQKVVAQFFMDVQPESLNDWQNLKRFCYRTLNIFALQLFFTKRLVADTHLRLQEERDWEDFFDRLCDPGIIKVIQFEEECRSSNLETKKKSQLITQVQHLLQNYFEIYSRFVETDKDERPGLRKVAVLVMQHFINVLEIMRQTEGFQPVVNQAGWLFGTERVIELKNQLS